MNRMGAVQGGRCRSWGRKWAVTAVASLGLVCAASHAVRLNIEPSRQGRDPDTSLRFAWQCFAMLHQSVRYPTYHSSLCATQIALSVIT